MFSTVPSAPMTCVMPCARALHALFSLANNQKQHVFSPPE